LRFLPCRDDDNVGNLRRRAPPKNSAAASCNSRVSGVTDHLADDERALRIVRRSVATFGPRHHARWEVTRTVEPTC
jgi:hypothetical protein